MYSLIVSIPGTDDNTWRRRVSGHRLQNRGNRLAILERDFDAPDVRFIEQLGEFLVAMDEALIKLELARCIVMHDAAGGTIGQRRSVVELRRALAMSILFGVDRKLFFLTRSARPFFNDGARNLDALRRSFYISRPESPFDEHHRAEPEHVEHLVEFLGDPLLPFAAMIKHH